MITVEGYPKHANTFWDILTTATTAIRTVPLIPNTDRFYAVHSAEIRSFSKAARASLPRSKGWIMRLASFSRKIRTFEEGPWGRGFRPLLRAF